MAFCGTLAPCPETWIMKKEMFFGISFYFAVCARSVAIRFVGVRCRGTHFAGDLQMLRARTGYGRIV